MVVLEYNIYTKLVNHADYSKEITLNFPEMKDGAKVELICLSGDSMDMNTMENQTKVVPVSKSTTLNGGKLIYEVPAMSLTVVKVNYSGKTPEPEPEPGPGPEPGIQEADKTKLKAAINAAKNKYKKADYTEASWKVYDKALKAAQKVLDNKDATQAQVNKADTDLKNAIKKLIKLKVISTKSITLGVGEKYSVLSKNCTYSTSNSKIAAVTKKGVVTPKKTGKTTVKAINKNGKVKVYKLTVKKAPKKISKVTPSKKTLKKGKTCKLKVTLPKGTASRLTFTSSNKKVATVNTKGVVKAKKKGKTVITVKTFNKKTKKVRITVK